MVYFIGIGGIGMSALARYFKQAGKIVAGYDLTPTPLTGRLTGEGIDISFVDDEETIPRRFRNSGPSAEVLIVVTPAVPERNRILRYFKRNGFSVLKRSQLLGALFSEGKGIAVAGTHGKTSVSTLTAHLLNQSPSGCAAFLGGVSKNYNSNLIISGKGNIIVTEADEFDRSFLHLFPDIAVITSMDPDHLDIYGSFSEMKSAYSEFAGQVKEGGTLIIKHNIRPDIRPKSNVTMLSYGLDEQADYYARNIRLNGNRLPVFDLITPSGSNENLKLGVAGRFNIENAVGASAAAITAGATPEHIRRGLESFQGIYRRFDILVNTPQSVLIDDYAHHPEELRACISSVREMFPGRELTGIFQPHLYSRTRDFSDGFAESLDALDRLILLDIYPAREEPIPGVSSELIFARVRLKNKILCKRDELLAIIGETDTDVVITLGAGNIDAMVEPLKHILLNR